MLTIWTCIIIEKNIKQLILNRHEWREWNFKRWEIEKGVNRKLEVKSMDLKYKAIMKVERFVRIFYQATDFINKSLKVIFLYNFIQIYSQNLLHFAHMSSIIILKD